MQIDSLIDEVIDREGGYVNHPADKGGPTRWGVTEAVARARPSSTAGSPTGSGEHAMASVNFVNLFS